MTEPTERVQVLKQESTSHGGDAADSDPFYGQEPINETEDMLSAAGLALQDTGLAADSTTKIWRDGADMKFKDGTNPSSKTLTELLAASPVIIAIPDPPSVYGDTFYHVGSVFLPAGTPTIEAHLGCDAGSPTATLEVRKNSDSSLAVTLTQTGVPTIVAGSPTIFAGTWYELWLKCSTVWNYALCRGVRFSY